MKRRIEKDRSNRYLHPRRFPRIRNKRLFYGLKVVEILAGAVWKASRGIEMRRHTNVSRDIYETYDDREMRIFENGQVFTERHGKLGFATFREIRDELLAPVIGEIERLLRESPDARPEILEVGCGNGTNLMLLKLRFGDAISLKGIDIAQQRIELGRSYWNEKLEGVDLQIDSATELTSLDDESMDLVFSVHCLEQLPYYVRDAVRAMKRVAKDRVVFVEPVFEYANTAQKLYAIIGDQLRTLMPEIEASGMQIVETYPVEIIGNPTNKSGVIVATKVNAD